MDESRLGPVMRMRGWEEGLAAPAQTPARMPWRDLKFSTQPELALNFSSEMWSMRAVSFALLRMELSLRVIFFSLHSSSH